MNILMFGDRNWTDFETIINVVNWIHTNYPESTIIHGAARGADKLSAEIAQNWPTGKFIVKPFPAKWNIYGRRAGPIRNQQMIDEGSIDLAFGFHNDIENSKGTKDMRDRLIKHNIKYYIVSSNNLPEFIRSNKI